jgi:hypothetical protein
VLVAAAALASLLGRMRHSINVRKNMKIKVRLSSTTRSKNHPEWRFFLLKILD